MTEMFACAKEGIIIRLLGLARAGDAGNGMLFPNLIDRFDELMWKMSYGTDIPACPGGWSFILDVWAECIPWGSPEWQDVRCDAGIDVFIESIGHLGDTAGICHVFGAIADGVPVEDVMA